MSEEHQDDNDWYTSPSGENIIRQKGSKAIYIGACIDGLSLYKSTVKEALPLLVYNMNFNPKSRHAYENYICVGLLMCHGKPKSMDALLIPFVHELRFLQHNKLSYFNALTKKDEERNVFLVQCIGDMEARVHILKHKTWASAQHGCSTCTISGSRKGKIIDFKGEIGQVKDREYFEKHADDSEAIDGLTILHNLD